VFVLIKRVLGPDLVMAPVEDIGIWQTVKSKDKHRKPRESNSKLPPTSIGLRSSIPAFAALDRRGSHEVVLSELEGGNLNDGSSGTTANDEGHTHDVKVMKSSSVNDSKSKKPKTKKLTTKDVVGSLPSADDFRATLKSIQQEYKHHEAMQLSKFANIFLTAYKDVDLKFNNLVNEGPLEKVWDVGIH
jgi:hypothetical protein